MAGYIPAVRFVVVEEFVDWMYQPPSSRLHNDKQPFRAALKSHPGHAALLRADSRAHLDKKPVEVLARQGHATRLCAVSYGPTLTP